MFSSCHSGYSLASVEGNRIEVTAALDANPDSTAIAILTPYQKTVDSIMSPVIGQSAVLWIAFVLKVSYPTW